MKIKKSRENRSLNFGCAQSLLHSPPQFPVPFDTRFTFELDGTPGQKIHPLLERPRANRKSSSRRSEISSGQGPCKIPVDAGDLRALEFIPSQNDPSEYRLYSKDCGEVGPHTGLCLAPRPSIRGCGTTCILPFAVPRQAKNVNGNGGSRQHSPAHPRNRRCVPPPLFTEVLAVWM